MSNKQEAPAVEQEPPVFTDETTNAQSLKANVKPQRDTAKAIEFLMNFCPGGPWVLTSIVPDGKPSTQTFTDPELMREWVDAVNGGENLYFHVNSAGGKHLLKKATKDDIVAAGWLHVDVDPNAGADHESERVRILAALRAYQPAPTVILDSGGGYQAFWKLTEEVDTTTEAGCAEVEGRNRALEKALGGDHCHNVDRIMRLPGTVNLPNKKKAKKGRTPRLAQVVHADWDAAYDIGEFVACAGDGDAPPPDAILFGDLPDVSDLQEGDISPALWRMATKMQAADGTPYDDRSKGVFAFCSEALREGLEPEMVAALLLRKDLLISDHIYERGGKDEAKYAMRQVQRAAERLEPEPAAQRPVTYELVPLVPVPDDLPARPWIVEGLAMRGAVSMGAAKGGGGKSLFALQVATMVATGQPWAHWQPRCSGPVLVLNAEDDVTELQRRLFAIRTVQDMPDNMPLYTMKIPNLVMIAKSSDKTERTDLFREVRRQAEALGVVLIVVDPLVETHAGMDENSNSEMMVVVGMLRELARLTNAGVLALHHSRKNSASGDQDSARGGSAFVNACRAVFTIEPMDKETADKLLGPDDRAEHWRWQRVASAKQNYAPRGSDLWLKTLSVDHRNGDSYPAMQKANVTGDIDFDITVAMRLVNRGRADGSPWSASRNAGDNSLRAALALEFDIGKEAAGRIEQALVAQGWIMEAEVTNASRNTRKVYQAGPRTQEGPF